jgi:hypothetical protein
MFSPEHSDQQWARMFSPEHSDQQWSKNVLSKAFRPTMEQECFLQSIQTNNGARMFSPEHSDQHWST